MVRLVDLPNDLLVKQAVTHAHDQQQKTTWFQKLSSWVSDHYFHGLLAHGAFTLPNAITILRNKWFSNICQLDDTKVEWFTDNMTFDLDQMASHLLSRPSPALFAFDQTQA